MPIQTLLAFFSYFSVLVGIGVISHRRQTSNAEFIVGNRSLNFWLTALSAHASDMSAWLFMGLPMAIYLQGLSGSWIAVGLLFGMFFNWQLIAPKLRIQTEKLNSYTLSTYFEKRYSDHSGTIRLITAVIILFFLIHYLSAGLMAMGLLLESVFGIDYYLGLTFALCVVVAYTFGGGYVTIAWTDFFQALFLLFVVLLVPILAFFSMDTISLNVEKIGYFNLFGDLTPRAFFSTLLLGLGWGLGYFGQPHIITKFMGIRDVKNMYKSQIIGMSWQLLALLASIMIGIVGALYFQFGLADPQLVFIEMVRSLFNPFIAGFILCGILAANLSTMDSQLLVCASVIGEDLCKRIFKRGVKPIYLVRASRFGVILIAVIALLISFDKNETILETVFYAWAGLGSAFGPLVLMSLYYPKANKYGAIVGIFVGGSVAVAWPSLNPYITTFEIPAIIPGFFMNLFSIYGVSKMTTRLFSV